jgi:PAS domain S-box-containing protein
MPKPVLSSQKQILATAVRTGVAYIIIACLWILLSDKLLLLFISDTDIGGFALAQTLKGWFFAIATGLLFTLVLYRKLRQIAQTQQALKEHGDNYQLLFESTPHPIWLYDPQTFAFLEVNKAAIETYGYSRDEFLSMTVHDILLPENEDQYSSLLLPQQSPVIRHHHRKDGAIRIVEVLSHPLLFFGREVVLVQIHDITERTLAEEKSRHSEERYKHIVDTTREGIWLADSNRVITFVNRRMAELLGYTEEEMTGRSLLDFMDEAERREAESYLEQNRQNGHKSHDVRFRHRNGRDVWTLVTISPMTDGGGRSTRTLGMVTDITERIVAEKELRKSENRLRNVLDNSVDVIYELRAENRSYSYISPSTLRVLGISAENLMQRGTDALVDLICEEDKAVAVNYYQQLFAVLQQHGEYRREEPVWIEYRIRYNDNEDRWMRETGVVLTSDNNLPVAIIGTIRDITHRKEADLVVHRMNRELEQRVAARTMELEVSNKELESFSYSVSHDLRAPLRSIDGFSKILLEDYLDSLDDRGQNYLQRIRAASQRMGQLIDDLLTLSRVTRSSINRVEINIRVMADALIQEYQRAQPARTLQFRNGLDIIVHADVTLMRIMLNNLLNNAWKFSSRRDDAVIELGTINNEDETIYFIRDNGVGFDMTYGHKLFGAFQRLHPVSEFEGTGMGLATAQRIIHKHGGRIWAEGTVGQGATFYFTLPV